jgi:hypothetical protein
MFTPEVMQQYREKGYVTFERFLGPEDLTKLREIFDREFGSRTAMPIDVKHIDAKMIQGIDPEQMVEMIKASGKYLEDYVDGRCAMRHLTYFYPDRELPDVFDTSVGRKIVTAAENLLEITAEELTVFACLLWKPPGGGPTPWHQEDAFDEPDKIQCTVGGWFAIDDADAENGCMTLIPGTHVGPLREHPALGRANVPPEELEGAISVPLPAGGALFFNGRILHGSHPNDSKRDRRSLTMLLRSPRLRTAAEHRPAGRIEKPRGSHVPPAAYQPQA